MEIRIVGTPPAPKANQLTAVIDLGPDRPLFDFAAARAHPAWSDLRRRRRGDTLKAPYLASGAEPLLYLPAVAAPHWDDDEKIRVLAAQAHDAASARRARLVILCNGKAGAEAAPLVAEGLALRDYRFTVYKESARPSKELTATLVCPPDVLPESRERVGRAVELIASVNRARDLVNEPGSVATPAEIEQRARAVARERRIKITVLRAKQLEAEGYNGLLTVGRGGVVPPRMIVLNYAPNKSVGETHPDVHLGLLGKGISFDTGGLSIKPSAQMWEMKSDMAGAAAVLHAIESIARLELPIRVTAVIVTAQNYVDANATVPGDIFRARNGKTIMVDNTDAEGRLVLTDGFWRMGEEGATHVVDVATLTGACLRALGNAVTGVFGHDGIVDRLIEAAAGQGEPCWRLPLIEEYRPWLDHEIADLNNISSVPLLAGATMAALFLREFVPEGVEWAHLDIAGTAFADKSHKYYRPGATGIMVRPLVALAERLSSL